MLSSFPLPRDLAFCRWRRRCRPGLVMRISRIEGARLQPCRNLLSFMVALATEDFGVEVQCDFPQGLKPNSPPLITARLKPCPFKATETDE